jgi:hypothetical protein
MKKTRALAISMAAALALTALAVPSAFADSRHPDETWRSGDQRRDDSDRQRRDDSDRRFRDDDHITMEGKVRSLRREGSGYRVELDRGDYSFWVPESAVRNRRDFRVGVAIRLGGIFRGGMIRVDVVDWPDYGRYGAGHYSVLVRGVVDRVDLRRDVLYLRDDSSRRLITVRMSRGEHQHGIGLDDLRRGDYVELSGEWNHGVFETRRVDTVRSGRY